MQAATAQNQDPGAILTTIGLDPISYTYEREVARGNLKIVHLVKDCRSDLLLAVKTINPAVLHSARNPEGLSGYHAEQILIGELKWFNKQALLSHADNLPKFGSIISERPLAIAYEYVPQSLISTVKSGLPPTLMPAFVEGIFAPIEAQIREKIFDGDIDPSQFGVRNRTTPVLLDADGGLTVSSHDANSIVMSTSIDSKSAQRLMAKVRFMSPEQAENQPNEERTSVYLLAQMVHFLATGQLPGKGQAIDLPQPYDKLNDILKQSLGPIGRRPASLAALKSEILDRLKGGDSSLTYVSSKLATLSGSNLRELADPSCFFQRQLRSWKLAAGAAIAFAPNGRFYTVSEGDYAKTFRTDADKPTNYTDYRAGRSLGYNEDSTKLFLARGRVLETVVFNDDGKAESSTTLRFTEKRGFFKRSLEPGSIVHLDLINKKLIIKDGLTLEIWDGPQVAKIKNIFNAPFTNSNILRGLYTREVRIPHHTGVAYLTCDNGTLMLSEGSRSQPLFNLPVVYSQSPDASNVIAALSHSLMRSHLSVVRFENDLEQTTPRCSVKVVTVASIEIPVSYGDIQFGRNQHEIIVGGDDGFLRLFNLEETSAGASIKQVAMNNFGEPIKSFGFTANNYILWVRTAQNVTLFGI